MLLSLPRIKQIAIKAFLKKEKYILTTNKCHENCTTIVQIKKVMYRLPHNSWNVLFPYLYGKRMVNALWANCERTLNVIWWRLWTVGERRAQNERWTHGERFVYALWTQDKWFIWSASEVISTLYFVRNQEKQKQNKNYIYELLSA